MSNLGFTAVQVADTTIAGITFHQECRITDVDFRNPTRIDTGNRATIKYIIERYTEDEHGNKTYKSELELRKKTIQKNVDVSVLAGLQQAVDTLFVSLHGEPPAEEEEEGEEE